MLTGFLQFSGSLELQYCCVAAGPMIIVIAICAIEALRDWSQQPTATVRHFIFVRLEIISNSRSSGLMDTFCNFPICFYLPKWQFKGCHLPSVQLVKTVIQYE